MQFTLLHQTSEYENLLKRYDKASNDIPWYLVPSHRIQDSKEVYSIISEVINKTVFFLKLLLLVISFTLALTKQ